MSKTVLYFEGAGMDFNEESSNVGNYRIRTAFINNDNQEIYLELSGTFFDDKKNNRFGWKTFITDCFNLSISTNQNESSIQLKTRTIGGYKKENIINWVNENLNCSFESMEVLDWLEGYRVHGGYKNGEYTYNLMDNHEKNDKRTVVRNEVYKNIDNEYRKLLNEKYSKISLLEMDDNSITIRCHASSESLEKAGLSENNRVKKIEINY